MIVLGHVGSLIAAAMIMALAQWPGVRWLWLAWTVPMGAAAGWALVDSCVTRSEPIVDSFLAFLTYLVMACGVGYVIFSFAQVF